MIVINIFFLCFFAINNINIKQPKISVIMPIYNIKKEYLIEAVESLMKQTLKEIEIILINDASTDNSSLIIENFAQKDQRITIIHKEKNEMTGKARNSGLDFATGNYLGFLDYDDIANKESFSVAYKEAIEGNFTVVTFRYLNFNETKEFYKKRCNRKIQNYHSIFLDENDFDVIKIVYVVPWNKIIKSSFIFKYNFKFFNTRGDEDALLFYTYFPYLKDKIKKIKSKQFFICRRQRKLSITQNEGPKNIKFQIVLDNLKSITFKKWEKDKIISIENSKKIMSVFYGIISIYCKDMFYKKWFINFLKTNRNVFNKKFIEKDDVRLFFWMQMLFLIKDVNYNKFETILNKENKCKIRL